MKNVLFLCLSICVIFFSCSKSGTSSPSGGTNTISATVDGVTESFNNIAYAKNISMSGAYSLVIAGTSSTAATADVMSITVDGDKPITTGAFSILDLSTSHYWPAIAYAKGSTVDYQEDITTTNPLHVSITALTSTNVQGTFDGVLVLYSGTGPATKTITNGKFNVNFK